MLCKVSKWVMSARMCLRAAALLPFTRETVSPGEILRDIIGWSLCWLLTVTTSRPDSTDCFLQDILLLSILGGVL